MLPFHSASICCWHFMMPYRSLFLSSSHGYKCFSLEDSIFTSCIKDYCINVVRFCIFSLYTPKLRTHRWKQHFAKKNCKDNLFPSLPTNSWDEIMYNTGMKLIWISFWTFLHSTSCDFLYYYLYYCLDSITVAFQQYFL